MTDKEPVELIVKNSNDLVVEEDVSFEEDSSRLKNEFLLSRLLKSFFRVNHHLHGSIANTTTHIFEIAAFSVEVIEAWQTHGVAGSAGTVTLEKLTPGQAGGAGVNVLAGTFDLSAAAFGAMRVKASTTKQDRIFNPGDRFSLVITNVGGSPKNLTLTTILRPISYNLSKNDEPT